MSQWKIVERTRLANGDAVTVHHTATSTYEKHKVEYCLETPLGVFTIIPVTVFRTMPEVPEFLYTVSLEGTSLDITDSLAEAKRVVKDYITNIVAICNNQLKGMEDN